MTDPMKLSAALSNAITSQTPLMRFAVLDDDKQVVLLSPSELLCWVKDGNDPREQIAYTEVLIGWWVSTVFLGGPVFAEEMMKERLFETAVIGDEVGTHPVNRYGNYQSAVAGHEEAIDELRERLLREQNL